ncbi:MAG TPA: thioredoxin family protein [Candidatus Obscuribacterales bacterium]
MSLTADESTFSTEVLGSSVPVLVHFWAPWCGVCRLVEPLLQSLQDEWLGHLRLVDVNADENLKLANQYRLTTLPTLLIFQNGNLCHRIEGFSGRDDLRTALTGYVQRLSVDLSPLQSAVQIRPFREV